MSTNLGTTYWLTLVKIQVSTHGTSDVNVEVSDLLERSQIEVERVGRPDGQIDEVWQVLGQN